MNLWHTNHCTRPECLMPEEMCSFMHVKQTTHCTRQLPALLYDIQQLAHCVRSTTSGILLPASSPKDPGDQCALWHLPPGP